ncbi:hypothetical protein CCM_08374 [Cordyceps militaris CM01]|uniref:Uncharacterized protein n=1 Tax=Cordyceps militaris (strain CM01) TaxID=983644 RepID=G3JR35_CORMM|nr:uncharacterized protein CCM_08374 [Cordyceps militaris CM01]EGX88331.1 hypothetical protein CCM_08374 [Cordyceps militaris CM01]
MSYKARASYEAIAATRQSSSAVPIGPSVMVDITISGFKKATFRIENLVWRRVDSSRLQYSRKWLGLVLPSNGMDNRQ